MLILRTIFVSLIGALFTVFVLIVSTATLTQHGVTLRLPDNHIVMDNVTLVHNADSNGGYSLLVADTAYFDRSAGILVMTDFSVTYEDGKLSFASQANRGEYTLNTRLMASGDLKGHHNDIQFKSGAGGLLLYDFNSLEGSMSGEDISFVENGSAIRADRVVHDGKSGHTAFEGNVYVEYLN